MIYKAPKSEWTESGRVLSRVAEVGCKETAMYKPKREKNILKKTIYTKLS